MRHTYFYMMTLSYMTLKTKNPSFLRLMTTRIFFLFYFLRDQNSQHFNEDILGINPCAFSFVVCFKAINYAGASNYVISVN